MRQTSHGWSNQAGKIILKAGQFAQYMVLMKPLYKGMYDIDKKSLHMSRVAHQAGAYPSFCSMKPQGPCMGCYSVTGIPPALNSLVSIYTPGWREAM